MDPINEDTPSTQEPSASGPSAAAAAKRPATDPPASGTSTSTAGASATSVTLQQLNKRRRGLGVVTPNACIKCRTKRAKCDGQKPCSRCKAQNDFECIYEVPVRQSKEKLRAEIEQLRRQKRSSDSVLAGLVRPKLWEEVLQRLRSGESVDILSEWLSVALPSDGGAPPVFGLGPVDPASGQLQDMRQDIEQSSPGGDQLPSHSQTVSTGSDSHLDTKNWTTSAPESRIGSSVESTGQVQGTEGPRYRDLDHVVAPVVPEMKVPAGAWTNVTSDSSLVQHLLGLYFCWEYPTFAPLSKEHFLKDFQDGRRRYCSSILVNALLTLGCRFSSLPNTRANANEPNTSGDHFFKECQRLFYLEESHHTLTTIQALGIMSIREASCGRDSESWYYAGQSIRLAIEIGLHRIPDGGSDEDEMAVQAATFWGAFALDQAWSLTTGSLPQCSYLPQLPPKPELIDDIEASLWILYTDDGVPLKQSCEQASNVRSIFKCFCELSELVHQSLYVLHSPNRPLTSWNLLNIYTQYLNWYDRIPEVLRLGHNFTPAVLFAHMYYHFAILLLFRPLIKLRIIGSSITPKDVCAQAAVAIQGLLQSYSRLYTLRRTPSFVPYFVLTSSIMHLAIGAASSPEYIEAETLSPTPGSSEKVPQVSKIDPRVAESINQGIADLTEMVPCHYFAEQALNILGYLAKKWDIDIDITPKSQPRTDDHDRNLRPLTNSLNFFAPNIIEEDFNCSLGSFLGAGTAAAPGVEATSTVATAASSMENPLFWPFPMQGRPILPSGKLLEEAGFSLL